MYRAGTLFTAVVGLTVACTGARDVDIRWKRFEPMGRAPSFQGPRGPTYYQAEVDVPNWGREELVVCADGVVWFAVFEAGGDPDLPPLFSTPGTWVMGARESAGCVLVTPGGAPRIAIRIAVSDTSEVGVRLTA